MNIPGFTAETALGKITDRSMNIPHDATKTGGVYPQGYTVHCYEGGHCVWRWVPEPGGVTTHPITKY